MKGNYELWDNTGIYRASRVGTATIRSMKKKVKKECKHKWVVKPLDGTRDMRALTWDFACICQKCLLKFLK